MRLPLPPIPPPAAGPLEDDWGFDPDYLRLVEPWLDLVYRRWWRVTTSGVENIPTSGPVLVVANHAGVIPADAAMMATGMRREARPRGSHRHPRFLVLDWAFSLPWASVAIRRFGGVPASPHNALALLRQGHVVMVFPEGAKGVGKPFDRRYRLERFGRGGFVELALRAGAPIVPCAVVGSEEIYPKIGELPFVARLTGAPYFPITPTFPLLGPLGAIPLPSRWRIAFDEPIDLGARVAREDALADRVAILELAEEIRARIQAKIFENLVEREGAFR